MISVLLSRTKLNLVYILFMCVSISRLRELKTERKAHSFSFFSFSVDNNFN